MKADAIKAHFKYDTCELLQWVSDKWLGASYVTGSYQVRLRIFKNTSCMPQFFIQPNFNRYAMVGGFSRISQPQRTCRKKENMFACKKPN